MPQVEEAAGEVGSPHAEHLAAAPADDGSTEAATAEAPAPPSPDPPEQWVVVAVDDGGPHSCCRGH